MGRWSQYQGSRRQELRDLVRAAGKRLWMSEVGFGGHPVDDIWAGLDISRCILNDLNVMQVNAWVYWQVGLPPATARTHFVQLSKKIHPP